jgi:hypothetical protein
MLLTGILQSMDQFYVRVPLYNTSMVTQLVLVVERSMIEIGEKRSNNSCKEKPRYTKTISAPQEVQKRTNSTWRCYQRLVITLLLWLPKKTIPACISWKGHPKAGLVRLRSQITSKLSLDSLPTLARLLITLERQKQPRTSGLYSKCLKINQVTVSPLKES